MPDYEEKSYWLAESPYEEGPSLDGSTKVDVAIVGGGFCGLSTAYYLKRADPCASPCSRTRSWDTGPAVATPASP
jgi:hypothetical protein